MGFCVGFWGAGPGWVQTSGSVTATGSISLGRSQVTASPPDAHGRPSVAALLGRRFSAVISVCGLVEAQGPEEGTIQKRSSDHDVLEMREQ